MRYPPNRDAAAWLARELVPLLRARFPSARVVVAGRGASGLALDGGVEVMSDVPDMAEVLRRSRVALVPLRLGTGSPFKLLEAAAGGAAVVCTRWSSERFEVPARIAETAEEYAGEVATLLGDERSRRELARSAMDALEQHTSPAASRRLEIVLAGAARR
jgi:glycosyltransferase involved in cell wall biosynthesis